VNIFRKIEETKALIKKMKDRMPTNIQAVNVAYDFITLYEKLNLWQSLGSKTFRLSKELIDAFTLTDIPLDITPNEFKYPFDTFLIEGEKPLYQVQIRKNDYADVHCLLFIDKRAIIKQPGDRYLTRNGEWLDDLEWDLSVSGLSPGLDGYGLDHMWLNMKNHETIENALKVENQAKEYRDTVSIPEAKRASNIFFNTIMYINDPTRIPVETESRGRAKYKLSGKKRTIKNEYILLRPPRNYISIPGVGTGRKVDKRFIVRGHYRNQVYGKGRLERKRIWIMPFWKGPELAEIVSKKYKVE